MTLTKPRRGNMEDIKHLFDVAAIGTTVATLIGLLPVISSAAAVVWMLLRIHGAILDNRIKKLQLEQLNDQQSKT